MECVLLKYVVSSTTKAEISGILYNHPQSAVPLNIDNITEAAFINSTLKQKRIKSWDMKFYWITDRVMIKQFLIYWDAGVNNIADYFTNHFSSTYHHIIRPRDILKEYYTSVQWYADIP